MSIEVMKRALEAIEDLWGDRPGIDSAIKMPHTAIQQPTTEPVQTTPNFTQLMQILDGLNRCHSRDSKVEFLRSWIRDWTQHKVDKLTHQAPSLPATSEPVWFHKHWGDDDDIFYRPDDKIPSGSTPLYTRPSPSLPDAITPPTEDGTEYDYASGYTAGYAEGWNEYRAGMAWLLDNN